MLKLYCEPETPQPQPHKLRATWLFCSAIFEIHLKWYWHKSDLLESMGNLWSLQEMIFFCHNFPARSSLPYGRSDPIRSDSTRSDPTRLEPTGASWTGPTRSDPTWPGPIRPDRDWSDPTRPRSVLSEPVRCDPARPDPTRPEVIRSDPTSLDRAIYCIRWTGKVQIKFHLCICRFWSVTNSVLPYFDIVMILFDIVITFLFKKKKKILLLHPLILL